jgi:hypothetical protein
MSNYINNTKKQISKMERGQVLVVVALSIVAIVAIIGLALDVGVMFIGNARLRRAVDSAALAAALQFREFYQISELDKSAEDFLRLNGINDPSALVQVCDTPEYHPDFNHTIPATKCPGSGEMQRKLVRVVASGTVHLAFLPVIGVTWVPIAAEAISETASVDVVLVIDRSESMTWTAPPPTTNPNTSDPMRDPSVCNYAANPDASYQGYCRPFDEVKKAAVSFVNSLYFPYDRVSVVTFDKNPHVVIHFSNDKGNIISHIKNLTVYQGEETGSDPTGINAIYPAGLPSRWYDSLGVYWGLQCPQEDSDLQASYPDYPDPAPCPTTNIGSGLYTAGVEYNIPPVRMNSLWVVILLTDGVANSGYDETGKYFCPDYTWGNSDIPPRCNDGNSSTYHGPSTNNAYDAEDYAYDGARFVAVSQNALIFTIGLGDKVTQPSTVDGTPLGEIFLKYAAEGIPNVSHGLYYFAPGGPQLAELFQKIADNIATRLEH